MSSRGRVELRRIDVFPWLRACGLSAVLVSAAFVVGCSGGSENTIPSVLADDKLPDASPSTAPSYASAPANGMSLNCPQVVAWPNERLLTIYESGHDGDTKFVIHRGELTKLSRECRFYPGRVVVKYGFAGRMLLGPKGRLVRTGKRLPPTGCRSQPRFPKGGRLAISRWCVKSPSRFRLERGPRTTKFSSPSRSRGSGR